MKKSDLIRAKIATLRVQAQETIDKEGVTAQELEQIENEITIEEKKLAIQLKNEEAEREELENANPLPVVENVELQNTDAPTNVLYEEAKDVQNYILGKANNMVVIKNELGTGTESAGGVAVGTTLSKEIIRTLKERANAYSFFDSRVGSGNFEIIIVSGETPAEWVSEGSNPSGTADPKTDKLVLKQHRLYKEIEITQQLVNSSPAEFVQTIVDIVVDALKDTLETAIFTGTGTNQPKGLTVGVKAGRKVTLATKGVITLGDLKKAKYKISQNDWGNCSWFMDATTLLEIDSLVDGNGRPLLQQDPTKATGNLILGIKVNVTNGMPAVGTASKAIIALAHKSSYQTNTQKVIALDVYNDSAYKKKGVVGIASNIYVDGNVKNENKVAVIVNPA